MVVAQPGKRRLYFHRQILPKLVTVSRCGIVIRIFVGISGVDVSVVRVPPIRKTERHEIKIVEEMAMMPFVPISEIPMVPKVAIPETTITSATRKSTRVKYPHPAESRTKATACESAQCVTTRDRSVTSTSSAH